MFGVFILIQMIALGLVLPVGAAIWWTKTKKEKFSAVLAGAATWLVFGLMLTRIISSILGRGMVANKALYVTMIALAAGILEVSGMIIALKYLLNRHTIKKETAIAYSIGYWGISMLFTLGTICLPFVILAMVNRQGRLEELVLFSLIAGVDVAPLVEITPGLILMVLYEKVFEMFLIAGLSILVFYGVKNAKKGYCLLAVALYGGYTALTYLYSVDVISSLYVAAAISALYAVLVFAFIVRNTLTNEQNE